MDFDNRENCIEWITDQEKAFVTFSQKRMKSKIRKLAEESDEVKIIKENEDGYLYASIPTKWIKVGKPRTVSDEQRDRMRENFRHLGNTACK